MYDDFMIERLWLSLYMALRKLDFSKTVLPNISLMRLHSFCMLCFLRKRTILISQLH